MRKIIISLCLLLVVSLVITGCGGEKMSTAVFNTNQGVIKLELFVDNAPITTGNFIKLAKEGFYDGSKFHRVIDNFMIQGGDPLSKDNNQKHMWGTGGPGYKIKDEFHPDLKNDIGTISMANAGPNTGGSQFFINVANNNFLDNKHAVFGKVTQGMDIVEKIAKVKKDRSDKPTSDVVIESISIE
jgi:cyclophilin family peptidyl-prolyl cis-trans isomerase